MTGASGAEASGAGQPGPGQIVASTEADGRLRLRLQGAWEVHFAHRLDAETARALAGAKAAPVVFDGAGLSSLDTAGAWVVARHKAALSAAGRAVEVEGFAEAHRSLYERVEAIETRPPDAEPTAPRRSLLDPVASLGAGTIERARSMLALVAFLGLVTTRMGGALLRPHRLRLTAVVFHVQMTGVNALPIVGLLSFLIGVVLAYQGADQLRQFGAEIFVVDLLGVSILRELGPLLTAIIVAGRSGSAFTAQIGTMMVNQEVDAMQTLGLDPVDRLVLPRMIALVISLPLLSFYADVMGLIGGALMAWIELGIHPNTFLARMQEAVEVRHLAVGLVKAPVFAGVVALVGCFQGLRVTGSAESVGRLTTTAVVQSIFLVIIVDAAFSVAFARMGI